MKLVLNLACILFLFAVNGQLPYADSIKKLRQEKQQSLLGTDDLLDSLERSKILSLDYYPVNERWIKHVQFVKDKGKPFEMPTSTDRLPRYRRVGYVDFQHEGESHRLTLYKNLDLVDPEYKYYYFLPFKDLSAPSETYGAGRYIELYQNIKKEKTFTIDFNTAFNPYCAYSYRYSCPITPEENHVDFRIEAGEKVPVMKSN
jgi:uncharacterized protein (DUF1684 family)